ATPTGTLTAGPTATRTATTTTSTPTQTSTPTLTATTTLTPTATATPGPCAPRPRGSVTVSPTADGRLMVGPAATTHAGQPANPNAGQRANLLQSVTLTRLTSAVVEYNGQVGVTGSLPLAQPTASVTFYVRHATAGQASSAELTITDGCGAWPTFVGGGPNAF